MIYRIHGIYIYIYTYADNICHLGGTFGRDQPGDGTLLSMHMCRILIVIQYSVMPCYPGCRASKHPMECHGILQTPMEPVRNPMESYGILRDPMESYGIQMGRYWGPLQTSFQSLLIRVSGSHLLCHLGGTLGRDRPEGYNS